MSNEKLSRNDVKVFYIYGEDFIVYYLSSTRIDIIFKIGNFFKSFVRNLNFYPYYYYVSLQ